MEKILLKLSSLKEFLIKLKKIKEKPNQEAYLESTKNIEFYLKDLFNLNPELFYIFKYRKITDNLTVDIDFAINRLSLIIELIEKIAENKDIYEEVSGLRDEIVKLLKDSDNFNIRKPDIIDYELWVNDLQNFFKLNRFTLSFQTDFIRITSKEYKQLRTFDGRDNLDVSFPQITSNIENIRELLVEIIITLIKHGAKIIKESVLPTQINVSQSTKNTSIKCFIIGTPCCTKKITEKDNLIFLAYNYNNKKIEKVIDEDIKPILTEKKLIPKIAKDLKVNYDFMCKICQLIQESKYFLADISDQNFNVGFELGIAVGLGKNTILMADIDSKEVSDLKRTEVIRYNYDLDKLKQDFSDMLKNIMLNVPSNECKK